MLRVVPPNCNKCSVAMRVMASMPPLSRDTKGAIVFKCEPCNLTTWVEQ
jgi:hypothetical protein